MTTQRLEAQAPSEPAANGRKSLNAATGYAAVSPSAPGAISGIAWAKDAAKPITSVADAYDALRDQEARVWIDATDASTQDLTQLADCLGLHPLIIEDIVERNQRAKVEFVADTLHLVMFALLYGEELSRIEIDMVLGKRFLLTSHPPGWEPSETSDIRRLGAEHFLSQGTDFMLYAIVDPLVDGYFPVLDRLGDQIDELEDEVVRQPDPEIVERLFRARRELLQVRHTVTPEREVFNQLTNREVGLIAPDRIIYFRDVYDHLIRITDELDTYRELVAGAIETYLSTINNNLSEIMKRLTSITAILAGVGAVAGIFGMSEAAQPSCSRKVWGFWL